ncbi:PpiC-type peptidyl-prolyl cis-trans isomerase [Sterolibacterium denitrificans]|uniref:peptidylprolyl isomerase n=1 Tax=Sterolibacterium denitrificans TaxID=157592 RepID=A0A7Z7MVD6_9PROT|nr:peptidylprolyl isomerase [Sterolibacterium denitrificans]SMB27201.1 PpiC-type peptidyl-prolyl cis-trans isomerase [Sterolibacterium denitrificans]
MRTPSRLLLSLLAATFVLTACNDQKSSTPAKQEAAQSETSPKLKEGVAAMVNGEPILESRVALLLEHFGSQNPEQAGNPETRKMVIEQLTMQTLIAQEALKKGLDKKPEIADQLELTRQTTLSNAFVQDLIASHPITDEALAAEYDRLKSQFAGNEYKARHILVDSEERAREIIAKLKKNPQSFAALAKANSKDPGSKEHGGDLGWFDPRAMVPEFGAALDKLEKGQITQEPVKTQFGYHIIALDDARQKDVAPLDQIKPMLKQQMQQQAMRKQLDELKAKAKIVIAEPPAPAAPAAATEPQEGTAENTDAAKESAAAGGKK